LTVSSGFVNDNIKPAVSSVYDKVSSVVGTVYNDGKGAVEGVGGFIENNVNKGYELINHAIDKGTGAVEGVASSLAMPIAIGAAVLGGIFLFKK
jgi:phage-related protein